jgi:hypothetical protein
MGKAVALVLTAFRQLDETFITTSTPRSNEEKA